MEPVKFWEVVQCGIRAGQSIEPVIENSRNDETGPWQKAADAIAQLFVNDKDNFGPAMIRFQALMDLYVHDTLSPWIRPSSESQANASTQQAGDDIHPAIIDVAATMRLSNNGRFAPRKFIEAVEQNVELNYRDFTPWPIDS